MASVPLAIPAAVVERVVAAPQAPLCPPVVDVHDTVTALAGTVLHALKDDDDEFTVRVQVRVVAPPVVFQETVAPAEPATDGFVSGSVAVNVIVELFTFGEVMLVAIGFSGTAAGARGVGVRPADVSSSAEVIRIDVISTLSRRVAVSRDVR